MNNSIIFSTFIFSSAIIFASSLRSFISCLSLAISSCLASIVDIFCQIVCSCQVRNPSSEPIALIRISFGPQISVFETVDIIVEFSIFQNQVSSVVISLIGVISSCTRTPSTVGSSIVANESVVSVFGSSKKEIALSGISAEVTLEVKIELSV